MFYFVDSSICAAFDVDNRPNHRVDDNSVEPRFFGVLTENRSYQRLGASIATSYDGVIATCAPLYVNHSPRGTKREPTGDCWVTTNQGAVFIRTSPCYDQFTSEYNQAFKTADQDLGWVSR